MIDSHQFLTAKAVHEKMQSAHPTLLVDVREPAEYRNGHAEGAQSVPLNTVSLEKLRQLNNQWDVETQPVFLICNFGMRALQAAETLFQQGVKHPVVVEGGTGAWQEARLPMVHTQSKMLSLEQQTQIALGGLLLLILFKGLVLHPVFYVLIGLLGIGLITAGVTARCTLTALLARMPWNQKPNTTA